MVPYIHVPDLHIGPLPLHPFGILVATGVLVTFQQIGLALGVSVALTVIGASARSGDSLLVAFRHGFLATSAMASLGFLAVLLLTRKPSHAVLPEGMAEA